MLRVTEISDTYQFILNQVMRTSLSLQFVNLYFLLNRRRGLLCLKKKGTVVRNQVRYKNNLKNQQDSLCLRKGSLYTVTYWYIYHH